MSAPVGVLVERPGAAMLMWRSLPSRVGMMIVVFFLLLAVFSPVVSPYGPLHNDWMAVLQPPSLAHPMGTDELGRDVLSRVMWGSQTAMFAAFVSVAQALIIGVPLGMIAAYFGGVTDILISRLTDTLLAVPGIMLAIALAMFLGGSLVNATFAIAVAAVPAFIRLARARTLQIRAEPYVEAARSVGVRTGRLLVIHVFPNLVPPLLVQAALAMAIAVIAEASLSFLGLGRPPPAPSWGAMLTVGKDYIATAPWLSLWPGLCIFLVTVAFSLLGDGLRQSLDRR